jgi:predicted TIM-barrel fold metal-dependent hydrolase
MAIDSTIDRVYEEELRPWLPARMVDCHVHVGRAEHCRPISRERNAAMWSLELGCHQTWEQMRAVYRTLFPEQEVSVLAFGLCIREVDFDRENAYVLRGLSDAANNARGLYITRPEWHPSKIENAMADGFVGIKPYPDVAPQDTSEVSIYDFLPRAHLSVVNELGGVVVLHVPREARLADSRNVDEVLEINDSYPDVKLIIAHVGRCYCLPTAERCLPHFADRPGIYFDTAANLNPDVLELALDTVGPDRMFFGSDLPITLMRGVREHRGETYINYTDGAYSWNTNRKSPEEEQCYTYYLYEELRALICAVRRCGLGKIGLEKILYANGERLFASSATDARKERVSVPQGVGD